MTNTVLLKRSGTPADSPLAANLQYGELAINYSDGSLYYKNASNVVTVIASNQFVSVTGNVTGGNLITSGNLSATGDITVGNISTTGSVSSVGNVYAGTGNTGYIYGNAFYMTGISAAISVTKIENGNSNVWVRDPGGDVTVTAGGVSNVAVFSTGSFTVAGAFATPKTITANVVVAENVNGMFLGPMAFGNSAYLTIPDSSTVYIYSPT